MVFWVPLILAAGQYASNANSARSARSAANKAQRRFEKQNLQFTNEALAQDYAALGARRAQERSVLDNNLEELTLDASRRIGAVSVASGESGVSGNTSAALINDFRRNQLVSEMHIQETEKFSQEQYSREVEAARTQAHSRLLGGQQDRVPQPNYMQMFLDATASYMQMSQQYDVAPKHTKPKGFDPSGLSTPPNTAPASHGSPSLPTS